MMLFPGIRASQCGHNLPHSLVALIPSHILWFQPTGLCSVPRQYLFSIHGWPTRLLPSSQVIFFQLPVSVSSNPYSASAPQREVTSLFWICIFIYTPLFLKEAFFLYQTPVAISTSPRSGPQGLGDLCISQRPAQCLAADISEIFVGWRNQELINAMEELT